MATIQNKSTVQNTQDFITIQDLFYLCLDKWHWFAISLALCLGVATFYLLRTPSVYVRTASILIKDDSKGKSSSTDMESFSDLGLFTTNTNVYNEMGTLKSPDIMREVVSRLHLEMNYQTDGRFHKQTVYGNQLPVQVVIPNLSENESATFELHLAKDGAVELSSFTRNGTEIENDGFVKGNLNDSIQSPLGPIVVIPSAAYSDKTVSTIYVTRQSLSAASAGCSARLNISQNDEKSNIITLSFQDVSTQRAEDVLNTLISVYNENWVRDKNQIAVSTSMFINERLGVIEGELGNVDDDISSFKSEHLLPDVQAAANMYMTQANEANAAIRELNNQAYMARYIKNYLTNENNKHQLLPANSGIENASLATQLNEYNTKLLERNSLVSHSSAKNPLVREMDKSLDDMRSALITSIDNQMVALRAQIRSLEAIGGQATSQIASNPKQSKYLLSVERQQKVKESLYLYLLQKREENELSQAFTAYNTRIITKPGGSMIPTAPVKKNIFLVAFALGILIPVVIIFIRENMNTRVRGRKEYETFISDELVKYVDSHYKTVADRKGRAITGLSMGGHGAMWNGLRHSDVFSAAGSTSGGVDIRPFPKNWEMSVQIGEKAQYPENWEKYTVINLVPTLRKDQIALIFDCGDSDFFLEVNKNYHEALLKQGIDHDFITRPGNHDSQYWNNSIDYQILFFWKHFLKMKAL